MKILLGISVLLTGYLLPSVAQIATAAESESAEPTYEFQFVSQSQGRTIMSAEDAYISRMSRFDRMLRLRTTQVVSAQTHLDFLAVNVLEWSDADKARLSPILKQLAAATQEYRLPLPPTVLLVKTTGDEEVGQAHTRANAIILPVRSLTQNDTELLFLLAHELFHIMSRHDVDFRERAYSLIGFRIGPEIFLPAAISPLQITNPDAPRHDSYLDVTSDGKSITVIPILMSRSAVFDPALGSELDHYWTLRLLVVSPKGADGSMIVPEKNGVPQLLKIGQVDGFFEQVGKLTRYIIHAEEILAEHFALLVSGAAVAEPQRLDALRRLLLRKNRAMQ